MSDTDVIILATSDIATNVQYIANNAWLTNQLIILIFGIVIGLICIYVIAKTITNLTEGG